MRAHALHSTVSTLFLAIGAAAQTQGGSIVVPREAALCEGNAADQSPFGRDRLRHIQYIHRDLLADLPRGIAITAIAYRRDGGDPGTTAMRIRPAETKQRPLWVVRMGRFRGDVAAPPCAYPGLDDPDFCVCFAPKPVDFPDLPASKGQPPPFAIVFPFDRPFRRTEDHLAIEHVVFHRPNVIYPYAVDAVEAHGEPGSVELDAEGTGSLRTSGFAGAPGGSLVLGAHGAPPRTPLGCVLRFDDGACEPSGVDRGSGTRLGIPLASNGEGESVLEMRLPRSLEFAKLRMQGEWLFADGGGAIRGARLRIETGTTSAPSAWKMAVVAGFPEAHAKDGFVQHGRGLVVQLRW